MPKPTKENEWLQKFVGTWESEVEIYMEPGKEPMKSKGSEVARMIGGFWLLSEVNAEMMGTPFTGIMTLGYDAKSQKYVGTWVDSMAGYLWKYEGSVDETGKILTMETEGPCPMMGPGKMFMFKEVTEFKSPDERVFSSSIKMEDGKWVTMMTGKAHRK